MITTRAGAGMAGTFVAFVGLPGAGKSTTSRALAELAGGVALNEPADWPPVVTDPDTSGGFSALTWFRAMRVPMYHRAVREREQDRFVVLDTYYDKICKHLLGAEGMDWFLSPADPYFDVYQEIARRDWETLPLPDVVINFRLREPVWRHFLASRARVYDEHWNVSRTMAIQEHFSAAAGELANTFEVPVLAFTPEVNGPEIAAMEILSLLRRNNLVAA
jgi:deoxyadenosine/deoxycytidine kinase